MTEDRAFEAFMDGQGPLAEALRGLPRAEVPRGLDDWFAVQMGAVPTLKDLRHPAPAGLEARILGRAAALEARAQQDGEPWPAAQPKYHVLGRRSRSPRRPQPWAYGLLAASLVLAVAGLNLTFRTQQFAERAQTPAAPFGDSRIVAVEVLQAKRREAEAEPAPLPAAPALQAPAEAADGHFKLEAQGLRELKAIKSDAGAWIGPLPVCPAEADALDRAGTAGPTGRESLESQPESGQLSPHPDRPDAWLLKGSRPGRPALCVADLRQRLTALAPRAPGATRAVRWRAVEGGIEIQAASTP